MFTSPLLAATIRDVTKLQFPLIATPKLDGIRCLTIPTEEKGKLCKAVTRKWKPIPNDRTRNWIETLLRPGWDGELMVEGGFNDVSSAIMKKSGDPRFFYHVFDFVGNKDLSQPYYERILNVFANAKEKEPIVKAVPISIMYRLEDLLKYEEQCLAEGYEGVMLRSQLSSYKCGRSTLNERKLLKLKRVDQSEAYVVCAFEEMANNNPLEQDAFGYAKRSTHAANKVGKERLGGFICKPEHLGPITLEDTHWAGQNRKDLRTATQKHPHFFSVGSGFNDLQRKEWWATPMQGFRITYAHQLLGAKSEGKPRFPRFKGFRPQDD